MGEVIQLSIVGVWCLMLGAHARRLLRLAHAAQPAPGSARAVRGTMRRIWWWLGREEFWRSIQQDALTCIECTVLLAIFAWGMLG